MLPLTARALRRLEFCVRVVRLAVTYFYHGQITAPAVAQQVFRS